MGRALSRIINHWVATGIDRIGQLPAQLLTVGLVNW
jgi:hypothetical protein